MGEPTTGALLVEDKVGKTPCSEFLKTMVGCPRCGRQMQAKTLQYKHQCYKTKQGKSGGLSAEVVVRRRARAEQRAWGNFYRRSGLGEDSTDEKKC